MSQLAYDETYSGGAAENYERFFVPAIGGPMAKDLIEAAALIPGERVLDVGCGTGVVTRTAAEKVRNTGAVAGLDVNPSMLAVARAATPQGVAIDWYEASAEAIPLPDDSFDVVLCQMSLQFMPGRLNALREMRRVLEPGGRLVLSVPGPTPPLFENFAAALAKHINPQAAPFVHAVFSLHDIDEIRQLASSAGFRQVNVSREMKALQLPSAENFMWEYIHSTPLVNAVAQGTDKQRLALEREVCERWQDFSSGAGLAIEVGMTTLIASG
jgi:ubiquinone/menaquinone biosynthesis C-methylase UbiE